MSTTSHERRPAPLSKSLRRPPHLKRRKARLPNHDERHPKGPLPVPAARPSSRESPSRLGEASTCDIGAVAPKSHQGWRDCLKSNIASTVDRVQHGCAAVVLYDAFGREWGCESWLLETPSCMRPATLCAGGTLETVGCGCEAARAGEWPHVSEACERP